MAVMVDTEGAAPLHKHVLVRRPGLTESLLKAYR